MSAKFNSEIAVIGIDIGKNSFHVVGHTWCNHASAEVVARDRGTSRRVRRRTARRAGASEAWCPEIFPRRLQDAAASAPRPRQLVAKAHIRMGKPVYSYCTVLSLGSK
jgi:hypothetical protein